MTGIYRVVNKINGKFYIGQSQNIKKRYLSHLNNAKYGINRPLYMDI